MGIRKSTVKLQSTRKKKPQFILVLFGLALLVFLTFMTANRVQASANQEPVDSGTPLYASCRYASMFTCYTDTYMRDKSQEVSNIQSPIGQYAYFIFYTSTDLTANNEAIHFLWQSLVYLVDGFIILVLVLEGLTILIGASFFTKAEMIEGIPRIILALFTVHFSYTICVAFLTLGNSLSFGMFSWANSLGTFVTANLTPQEHKCLEEHRTWYTLGIGKECTKWQESADPQQILTGNADDLNFDQHFISIDDAVSAPEKMFDFVLQTASLILFIQGVTRLFLIVLYMVLSPLGMVCWAFPGKIGMPVTKLWLHGFISLCMVQFLQTVGILVTGASIQAITAFMKGQLNGAVTDVLLSRIVRMGTIWFVVRIPGMMQTGPLQMVVAAGQMAGQTVNAAMNMQLTKTTTDYSLTKAKQSAVISGIGAVAQVGLLFVK